MKLFSIITICWNNLEELKFTYRSISNQTNRDFEWIVADGGSTDGTKEWLSKNKIAKWVSEPDKGIFNAMNKGLSRANGKYLIFMNSGDSFASNTVLENVSNEINKNNFPAFVYGDSIDVDENKNEHYRNAKNSNKNWFGMITQHQSMFFSSKVLKGVKYIESYAITADYAFISQVLKKLEKEEILKLNIAVCKFDMGGTNEQHRFKGLKEDFKIRKEIIKVPLLANVILYELHYIHTLLKKINPSVRFIRHQSN